MDQRLIFRQLFDPTSSSYTYLLGDPVSREALLVDPVIEQVRRDLALVRDLGLRLLATLDTHIHADHITGAAAIRSLLGTRVLISKTSGAEGADAYLTGGQIVPFGARSLTALATPGHTPGCMTYLLDERTLAMTGDCLLVRACGRTDFQEGNSRQLYHSVHEQIFALDDDCLLYPAHDYRGLTVTTVGEERRYNPRLGGALSESDFTTYMDNLGLAHPKLIKEAVPANRQCGASAASQAAMKLPGFAAAVCSFAGIWEVDGTWLEENLGAVQLLDVREPDEFNGPLGHIPGARLLPLGTLAQAAGTLDAGKPIVTICRAGGRSAQAMVILNRAGRNDVASLAGGMLRWNSAGLVTQRAGA